MVIFLVGLVSMILMRTLRKDYARYSKDEELDDMVCLSHLKMYLSSFVYNFKRWVAVMDSRSPAHNDSYGTVKFLYVFILIMSNDSLVTEVTGYRLDKNVFHSCKGAFFCHYCRTGCVPHLSVWIQSSVNSFPE
jgi:hypothetical protein